MPTDELVMSAEEIAAEIDAPDGQDDSEGPAPSITPEGDDMDGVAPDDDTELAEDGDDQPRKSAPSVRKYKANGKEVEVDHTDVARVDQLITLGLGARSVFTERDNLKKAAVAKDKQIAELSKFQKLWSQLEESKNDHDGLYEKIFGKKFDESAGERAAQKAAYDNASPEERRLIDLQRQLADTEKSTSRAAAETRKRQEAIEAKEREAEVREYKSRLSSEFFKHEFSSKVDDPVQAEKLNKILWRNVVADLKQEFGEADEIPADAIRRAFKENASVLGGNAKQQAAREVKQATEQKKKKAATDAAAAAGRNYSKPGSDKLAVEKDPVKLFKKMFG